MNVYFGFIMALLLKFKIAKSIIIQILFNFADAMDLLDG